MSPAHAGPTGPDDVPIVDSHVHVFTKDMPLAPHAWVRPEYEFTAEDLIATMDAHGVGHAVIAAISLYGHHNDYTVDVLRRHPRLGGTANVAPGTPLAELRALAEAGISGVRLFLVSQIVGEVPDLRDPAHQQLLRHVRELDWHVHLVAQEDAFADAVDVLLAAGVKLVFDHFADTDPSAGTDSPKLATALRAIDAGNAWMKISAGFRLAGRTPPRDAGDYARARDLEARLDAFLLDRVGADRLLWGSDCPFMGHEGEVAYGDVLDAFRAAVPDPRTRRAIAETARSFYFG